MIRYLLVNVKAPNFYTLTNNLDIFVQLWASACRSVQKRGTGIPAVIPMPHLSGPADVPYDHSHAEHSNT